MEKRRKGMGERGRKMESVKKKRLEKERVWGGRGSYRMVERSKIDTRVDKPVRVS